MSKFKFFNFSNLRRFLKQDLRSLSYRRFSQGYRQTHTCEDCNDVIYSSYSDEEVECGCGKYRMRENSYFYKFENTLNPLLTNHRQLRSVRYPQLERRILQ